MPKPLDPFKQGQSLTSPQFRSQLNQGVDLLNMLRTINSGFGILIDRSGSGLTVRLDDSVLRNSGQFYAKITGNDGSGGHSWTEQQFNSSTGVFEDKSGGKTGTSNAYELNGETAETDTIVYLHPVPNDTKPYRFALGGGGSGTADSPSDLTYTGEHTEAAISDSGWDRDNPPALTDGVKISLSTGLSYYSAGNQTLYGYVRDFTFDSTGALKLISAERRIVIDAPQACVTNVVGGTL